MLGHPFLQRAAQDIDPLIHAWRAAKEAEAEAEADCGGAPSRASLARDRTASAATRRNASHASHSAHERSTSAASASQPAALFAAPPCGYTGAIPIPNRMPPSSLLSISPEGYGADAPRPESTADLHPCHSSELGSVASSQGSLPPDYPDLPSLTMPVSIRRAYSSAASLHAQCRVQMLSNAAEMAWQDPAGAGALMA